jgi:hypothetical protein
MAKGWTTVECGSFCGRYTRYFSFPEGSYLLGHSAASSVGNEGTLYRDKATTAWTVLLIPPTVKDDNE